MDAPLNPNRDNTSGSNYTEVILDDKAVDYIYDLLLSVKERGLVSQLLEQLDLPKGQVTAYLPEDVDPEAYRNFRSGRNLRSSPAEEWLINRMMRHMSTCPDGACVFDQVLSYTTDSWLLRWMAEHPERPYKFRGREEVYEVCIRPDPEELCLAWGDSNLGLLSFGIMTHVSDIGKWNTTSEIVLDDLREPARNTVQLFVNAYDEEGYLIWDRRCRRMGE